MHQDFARSPLDKALDFTYDEVGPDKVTLSWTVGEQHLQPYGILHGGVLCAAVESTASVAGAMWFAGRGNVVGVSNHTNFLRATRPGDRLNAAATPIHRGRLQQLWLVEITDDQQRLVARGEVRLQNLSEPVNSPPQ